MMDDPSSAPKNTTETEPRPYALLGRCIMALGGLVLLFAAVIIADASTNPGADGYVLPFGVFLLAVALGALWGGRRLL